MPAYFTLSKNKIQYINGTIVHICKAKRRKLSSEAREMAGGILLRGPSKEYKAVDLIASAHPRTRADLCTWIHLNPPS